MKSIAYVCVYIYIRAKLKKLELCWSIKGQNAQIQNQWSKWKRQRTSRMTFEYDRDAFELILKIKISIKGVAMS